MEADLVFSVGTIIGIVGIFYTWHKDSKQQANEITSLKVRVKSLETQVNKADVVLQELLSSVQEIKVSLAKIDTKLTIFDEFTKENKKD